MNDPQENLSDELLEDLLQQLRSVEPPVETQSANRNAVRQALATRIRPAWWQRTVAVPVPVAIAASILLLVAAVVHFRPTAFGGNANQPSPLTAAQQTDHHSTTTNAPIREATTPTWSIQRSFIRTLTSSTANEFVAFNPLENRDDS